MFSVDRDILYNLFQKSRQGRKLVLVADYSLILGLPPGATDCPREIPFVQGACGVLCPLLPLPWPWRAVVCVSVSSPVFPVTGSGLCMFGWAVTGVMLCSHCGSQGPVLADDHPGHQISTAQSLCIRYSYFIGSSLKWYENITSFETFNIHCVCVCGCQETAYSSQLWPPVLWVLSSGHQAQQEVPLPRSHVTRPTFTVLGGFIQRVPLLLWLFMFRLC